MKSNTFRLSGQNSLKINEVPREKQKNLLNTFKGGSDLRNQLGQIKTMTKPIKIDKKMNSSMKQAKRPEDDILAQEVAALDHFKVPVTREKTKNMIENIKLRRRQQHINAMDRFREDLDDYKENLLGIYSSILNDIEQVMNIKESHLEEYISSCSNDEYLLSKQKDFIIGVEEQTENYKSECDHKLKNTKADFEKVKESRGNVVQETCQKLRNQLIDIAFVLEAEARQIQNNQKKQIQKLEAKYYEEHADRFKALFQKQIQRNEKISQLSKTLIARWKKVKQEFELASYKKQMDENFLRNPQNRVQLYQKLIKIQENDYERKKKILHSLILQNPDTLNKNNLNKWNEELKKINDIFDAQFDQNLKDIMEVEEVIKKNNEERYSYCKQRLIYIEQNTAEEIAEIMKEQCQPLLERNKKQSKDMLKQSTDYVEVLDDRGNQMLGKFFTFSSRLGTINDSFVNKFAQINQKYEIEKAKILDQDQEHVEKLQEELAQLKKELRQSLHHIKLDEMQQKCFSKVDQIQTAYRNCHQKNKSLTETRGPSINDFFSNFQANIAEVFELYDPSRKAELEEKNKKESQDEAMKRIQKEDKKKAQQEEKLIEETKKKGGKPPPAAKPKDPKKLAAEIEERKKAILAEMGPKKIQELKSNTGALWLVYRNAEQICKEFYKIEQEKKQQKQQDEQKKENKQEKPEQEEEKPVDFVKQPITDCHGIPIVTQKAFIVLKDLVPQLTELREKFFENLSKKKERVLHQADEADQDLLEDSLTTLDSRLKAHYSLKGKIQSQIYVRRYGQITNHKKKYEKHVRIIKQKMDLQTEKFNFLLEKGLQSMKEHNQEQKKLRQKISEAKNLSELQGMQSRTRENYNSFGISMRQICNELERLCNVEVDVLLQKNANFIKQSKLLEQGGEYSPQEISWYKQMLQEVTKQMKDQQEKRNGKLDELRDHTQKRRKQLFDSFQKQYAMAIEELAAKDGTGKKYGRPKRIAQEKIRYEMNKCEQAQINIDKSIHQLKKISQTREQGKPQTLQWRKKLMTIQTCISRYGKYIEAFRGDIVIAPMIRVNYNQKICECKLPAEEQDEDKKRLSQELAMLGTLSEQKDERVFMKYIEDIEKIISDESRTIYVGDKAKYLTGNDKIPDFLRTYILGMKKSAEQFRINCIRELRQSCNNFSEIIRDVIELFFSSIFHYYDNEQNIQIKGIKQKFTAFYQEHKNNRDSHLQKLRPNLSNPKCQEELATLDQKEKDRTKSFDQTLAQISLKFKDEHFSNAESFLNVVLNNYEFLILFADAVYLNEDFVQLPGDDVEEKKHLDIKRLMIMKQKGIKIDSSSQRNIRKKWEGVDFKIFDIEQRKFVYKLMADQPAKEGNKKGAKKQGKDPKKVVEEPQETDNRLTKIIETFKTWRQKSVYEARNNVYSNYRKNFEQQLNHISQLLENSGKQNSSFNIKWDQITKQLYIDGQ